MIASLSIRNFAIIDRLDVEFGPGLNVLTGETGAGKSILVGALTVILGGRAGGEMIRSGAEKAVIDAIFEVSGSPSVQNALDELGFEAEDGILLVTREIQAGGKSAARIGGRPSTISQLKELGDCLVDLHGQHEHQSLLLIPRHLEILDEWGGPESVGMRDCVRRSFLTLQQLEREQAALTTDARERERLLDLYRFQLDEITEAALTPGEDEDLRTDLRKLANAQNLADAANLARSCLSGDSGIAEQIAVAAREIEGAAGIDEAFLPILESIESARFGLQEVDRDLAHYLDFIEFDPARQQQIDDRLDRINSLKRKYGDSIEEILAFAEKTAEQLDSLDRSEERGRDLESAIELAEEQLTESCRNLSKRRRVLAEEFARAVLTELSELAMEKTRFEVAVDPWEPSVTGADRAEFLIAPNQGESLKPLAKIASGGEVSRVMLAIKGAMSRQDPLPTMVFDEIDSGVGGRTASVLGEKLSLLAQNAQILCITHLPQIAARASRHFYIEKRIEGGRTVTDISPLSESARVEELARMLGGKDVSDTALQHAREMLHLS